MYVIILVLSILFCVFAESANRNNDYKRYGNTDQSNKVYYSSKVLWFKAAVIAVPIAGGFILIMLVLLAVRMLRRDSQRHREYKHHQSLAKAQLYVADHFYNNPNNKLLHTYVTCDGGGKTDNLKQYHSEVQPCVHTSASTDSHTHSGINHKGIYRDTTPSHSGLQPAPSPVKVSETSSQKYPYEKLRDSTGPVDNPQESVVMVWPEEQKSNTQPIDVV